MSTYRDDLEAAQARAEAAQAEAERLRKEVQRLKEPRSGEPLEIPIPERFNVERTASELRVSWRWWRAHHWFLLFFVIAWDAFLVFWYFGSPAAHGGLLFKIFPIAHVAVGAGLTYSVLTGAFNRTVLSARRGHLRVKHGPLPWRGNRDIDAADIRQLFVTEVVSRHTDSDTNRTTVTHAYDLRVVLTSNKEVTLVRKLESHAQGEYLERTFERYLGIEDRRVPGEVDKSR